MLKKTPIKIFFFDDQKQVWGVEKAKEKFLIFRGKKMAS